MLGDLLPLFNSRSFDRGRHVVRPGERARHLFVVLEGELETIGKGGDHPPRRGRRVRPHPGPRRQWPPVRVLAKSKLLAIEEDELHMLTLRYPDISRRLAEIAGRPTGSAHARRAKAPPG